MAEVTGFTAERMLEIENSTIVDGDIVGDDLILKTRDDTEINAGTVVGPMGPQGPPGSDPSIVICTSGTRPTGIDLFEGLGIYETDTQRVYFYDGSAWVYHSGLWVCTSGTHPGSPFEGLMIYETDTNRLYIYTGSAYENIWVGPRPVGVGVRGGVSPTQVVSSTTGVDWSASNPFEVAFTKRAAAAESSILVRLGFTGFTTGVGWWNIFGGVKISGTNHWGIPHPNNSQNEHQEWNDEILIAGRPAGTVTMRAVVKMIAGSQNASFDVGDFFRIAYEEIPI